VKVAVSATVCPAPLLTGGLGPQLFGRLADKTRASICCCQGPIFPSPPETARCSAIGGASLLLTSLLPGLLQALLREVGCQRFPALCGWAGSEF
jgi:hypothetical protein